MDMDLIDIANQLVLVLMNSHNRCRLGMKDDASVRTQRNDPVS